MSNPQEQPAPEGTSSIPVNLAAFMPPEPTAGRLYQADPEDAPDFWLDANGNVTNDPLRARAVTGMSYSVSTQAGPMDLSAVPEPAEERAAAEPTPFDAYVAATGARRIAATWAPAAPTAAPRRAAVSASVAPARVQPTGASDRTNTLALLALIFGIMAGGLLPIVLGHIALSQIDRTGEGGRGMAVGGLVLGYLGIGASVVILIVFAVLSTTGT